MRECDRLPRRIGDVRRVSPSTPPTANSNRWYRSAVLFEQRCETTLVIGVGLGDVGGELGGFRSQRIGVGECLSVDMRQVVALGVRDEGLSGLATASINVRMGGVVGAFPRL